MGTNKTFITRTRSKNVSREQWISKYVHNNNIVHIIYIRKRVWTDAAGDYKYLTTSILTTTINE